MSLIIGIDPDLVKSGVAYWENGELMFSCLGIVDLLDFVKAEKDRIKKVVVEAGWLNQKSNWHGAKSILIAGRMGKNVGENHAAGKLIVEQIEAMEVQVQLVVPRTSKLDAGRFKRLTGYMGSTNQEVRDAAMLVWGMV